MTDELGSGAAPLKQEWNYSAARPYLMLYFALLSIYVGVWEVRLLHARQASQVGSYFLAVQHLLPWTVALSWLIVTRRCAMNRSINSKAGYLCYFAINAILSIAYLVITDLYLATSIR